MGGGGWPRKGAKRAQKSYWERRSRRGAKAQGETSGGKSEPES